MSMLDNEPLLVSGGYDHTIKLWQPYSGVCCKTIQYGDSQVNALEISPNRTILAACGYQQIKLYDMNHNVNPIVNFENLTKNITRIGFQEEGKWMFTGGCSDVRIWDLNSPNPVCKRLFDCLSPVNAVSLHPNQVELAIGAQNGGVYLWDVKSDKHEQLIPEVDTSIQDVAISPNAMYMAAVNNKGNCFIWNLKTGDENQLTSTAPRLKLDAHKKYALRCRFSPDSNYLVTTSADSTARIYKTENFTLHRELKVDINNRWIWDAIFSNDSKYLFTASSDCIARLWKIETRTVEREYVGHQKAITAIAFRDEKILKT